jgi:nicotinamide-nucleotide amidase
MNAEILAVGSELLTASRIDTNSLWLTDQLNAIGVEVTAKSIVGDDRPRLTAMLLQSLERAEIVLITGGLGPTEDDVTRDAVAVAAGKPLVFQQDLCDEIAAFFTRLGRTMTGNNRRQAHLIEGFDSLPNPRGTARGLLGEINGRFVALLPGPPHELKPMFVNHCLPRLKDKFPPQHIAVVHFRVAGLGESALDALIAPVYSTYSNPVTTILAAPGDVQIFLRALCATEAGARELADDLGAKITEILGDRIYSRNGSDLATATGALLRSRKETISVAESCTGGLVGQKLTAAAGSSDYFAGGFLTYSDAMKADLLGVPATVLQAHSAVSEPSARAMAEGARKRTGSTWALSVTGYAGPDGGTQQDPVGTVYLGLAGPQDTEVKRIQVPGDRERVRELAATSAIDLLRRRIQ